MSRPEAPQAEPLPMNALETVMIGGGAITGIIELSAAGPNQLEWNAVGLASLSVAALGVYLNHWREQSAQTLHKDQAISSINPER